MLTSDSDLLGDAGARSQAGRAGGDRAERTSILITGVLIGRAHRS